MQSHSKKRCGKKNVASFGNSTISLDDFPRPQGICPIASPIAQCSLRKSSRSRDRAQKPWCWTQFVVGDRCFTSHLLELHDLGKTERQTYSIYSIYIYLHVYICVWVCNDVYVYIYIYRRGSDMIKLRIIKGWPSSIIQLFVHNLVHMISQHLLDDWSLVFQVRAGHPPEAETDITAVLSKGSGTREKCLGL